MDSVRLPAAAFWRCTSAQLADITSNCERTRRTRRRPRHPRYAAAIFVAAFSRVTLFRSCSNSFRRATAALRAARPRAMRWIAMISAPLFRSM
eukprot:scaffold2566_cov33-Tisochrysis_lutea.AAC.3